MLNMNDWYNERNVLINEREELLGEGGELSPGDRARDAELSRKIDALNVRISAAERSRDAHALATSRPAPDSRARALKEKCGVARKSS